MGSKSKNGNNAAKRVVTEQEQDPQSGTVEVKAEEKPSVDRKALFLAYDASNDEVKAAEAALSAAEQHRSDTVKAIAEGAGTGPFNWNGKECSITTRTKKVTNADGEQVEVTNYFFKTFKRAVEVI